jgi:hypothetical protein
MLFQRVSAMTTTGSGNSHSCSRSHWGQRTGIFTSGIPAASPGVLALGALASPLEWEFIGLEDLFTAPPILSCHPISAVLHRDGPPAYFKRNLYRLIAESSAILLLHFCGSMLCRLASEHRGMTLSQRCG